MGWKIKRIIALIVILGILFVQYSGGTNVSHAQSNDTEVSDEASGEETETGTEPEEEEEKTEEEEEEENIECYQLSVQEENGKNGYYRSKPEVKIVHVSSKGITEYSLINAKGETLKGRLKEKGAEAVLEGDAFSEGANRLRIWMEDEEGKQLEEYDCEKLFMIDTKKPKISLRTPQGEDVWYQSEMLLSVSAEEGEHESQIAEIVCYAEDQFVGKTTEKTAVFPITSASVNGKAVRIKVTAQDRAGNDAEAYCEVYIDQSLPTAVLEGVSDYKITSKPFQFSYQVTEENLIGTLEANTIWEHTDGMVTEIPVQTWEETDHGKKAVQILSEDGTYQMNLKVTDCAGHEALASAQVIIDKKNPVIRYIDQLDGKYLKEFCWQYRAEDWIHDYTSFSYIVRLDGKNYHMGEKIGVEGRHMLTVKAVDSAGNIGEAEAEFVIDHTAPSICFTDVDDGEEYEKEKTFGISTAEQSDRITEVRINGEKQEILQSNGVARFHVQEVKNYEVEVTAVDMAGNQKTARIGFQVIPEKTILQKITEPIKEKIWKQQKTEGTEAQEENEKHIYKWLIMGSIFLMVVASGLFIRYRKKRHKREDAG